MYIYIYKHIRRPFQGRACWTSSATFHRRIIISMCVARQHGSKADKAAKAAKIGRQAPRQAMWQGRPMQHSNNTARQLMDLKSPMDLGPWTWD